MKQSASKEHYIRYLRRQLFHLWGFIAQEGLWLDACEFLKDCSDYAGPYEYDLFDEAISLFETTADSPGHLVE